MGAETVGEECNLQFIWPNQTWWNSTYMAVERIVQIILVKGQGAIRNVREIKGENRVRVRASPVRLDLLMADRSTQPDVLCVEKPFIHGLDLDLIRVPGTQGRLTQ